MHSLGGGNGNGDSGPNNHNHIDVGSELSSLLDQLKQDIRSILSTSKDGVTEQELKRDYYNFTGRHFPHVVLGFKSVFDMMRSLTDTVIVRKDFNKGIFLYYPVDTEQTREIANLVRGQKSQPRSTRDMRRDTEGKYLAGIRTLNGFGGNYRAGISTAGAGFGGGLQQPQQRLNDPSIVRQKIIPFNIQNRIRDTLVDQKKVTLKEFEIFYKRKNGYMYNYRLYGYDTLIDSLLSLNHLIRVEKVKKLEKTDEQANRFIYDDEYVLISLLANGDMAPAAAVMNGDHNHNNHHQQQQQQPTSLRNHSSAASSMAPINNSNNNKLVVDANEMAARILSIVRSHGAEGIFPSMIMCEYQAKYNQFIEYEQLGYEALNEFISEKLNEQVFYDYSKADGEPKVYEINEQQNIRLKKSGGRGGATNNEQQFYTHAQKKNYEDFKELVHLTFANNKKIRVKDFQKIFEQHNGYTVSVDEFGFRSFKDLIYKLIEDDLFVPEFIDLRLDSLIYQRRNSDLNNNKNSTSNYNGNLSFQHCNDSSGSKMIIRSHKNASFNSTKSLSESGKSKEDTISSIDKDDSAYKRKLLQAEFIQSQVVTKLDPDELLKTFAKKQKHRVLVSNVSSPCDFQIQIIENLPALEKLMDDIEKLYYGIGSSHFDMPPEFVEHGRLCAAVFSGDKNWHRCRITGHYKDQKSVRVQFIDYGGSANVRISDLKFLASKFGHLPIQAVNARLYGLKAPVENIWQKNIVDYMLDKIKHKVFIAEIVGFNEFYLSVELFEELVINKELQTSKISLNHIIQKECYAKSYDESNDVDFLPFEVWQENMFKKYGLDLNSQEPRASVSSSATGGEKNHQPQSQPQSQPPQQHQQQQSPTTSELSGSGKSNLKLSPEAMSSENSSQVKNDEPSSKSASQTSSSITPQQQQQQQSQTQPQQQPQQQQQKQKQFEAIDEHVELAAAVVDNKSTVSSVFNPDHYSKNGDLMVLKIRNNETKIKIKEIFVNQDQYQTKLDLFNVNGTVYVYWEQFASLIFQQPSTFKCFIYKEFEEQRTVSRARTFIVKFENMPANYSLFELLAQMLNISIEEIQSDNGAYFCIYKNLLYLCDLILKPSYAEQLKEMLKRSSKQNSSTSNPSKPKHQRADSKSRENVARSGTTLTSLMQSMN